MTNLTQCVRGGSIDNRPGFVIAFYYNTGLIETLKARVPHYDREWRELSRTWWVAEEYAGVLEEMFRNFRTLIYNQTRMEL